MSHRKHREIAEQKPTDVLRRSPRLLRRNFGGENWGLPKPALKKLAAPGSFSMPLGSCVTKTRKDGDGVLQKGGGGSTKLKSSANSIRKSARLASRENISCLDWQSGCMVEKRVTRSSIGGKRIENSQENEFGEVSEKRERKIISSEKAGKGLKRSARVNKIEVLTPEKQSGGSRRSARLADRANVSKSEGVLTPQMQSGIGSRRSARIGDRASVIESEEFFIPQKQNVIEKRVTRSSLRQKKVVIVELSDSGSEEDSGEKVRLPSKERKEKDVADCDFRIGNADKSYKRMACVGEKRKRRQVEEEHEIVQGWTKEQELALQRAYFAAKPTPHFWKKVARMVPGKSAKECFDRIQSDHLTPSQPPKRSRAKTKYLSPVSFSASKLLSPTEKCKKLRSRRRTILAAQKTVRQLLQKQHNEDQDYEADLFSILEPTIDPSPLNFQVATPFASSSPIQGSSSGKQRSRLGNSSQNAGFVSPPVLKPIKNKALHEKYIDQLHCRDAKRNAAALRNAKTVKGQSDEKVGVFKMNIVKVAKDALVSDALDAINQLNSLKFDTGHSIDDDDSTGLSVENEDEEELS